MRLTLASLLAVAACDSGSALPDTKTIASHVTAVVADESGVYWATRDGGLYARPTGGAATKIAQLDEAPVDIDHDGTQLVFYTFHNDAPQDDLHIIEDTGGEIRTMTLQNLNGTIKALDGTLYMHASFAGPGGVDRIDLETGARVSQTLGGQSSGTSGGASQIWKLDGKIFFSITYGGDAYNVPLDPMGTPAPLTGRGFETIGLGWAAGRYVISAGENIINDNQSGHLYTFGSELTDLGSQWVYLGQAVGIGDDAWMTTENGFVVLHADDTFDELSSSVSGLLATDGTSLYVQELGDDERLLEQPLPY